MISVSQFQLLCPVCQSPLEGDNKHLRCTNNHSYDAARQGYWNLLLANQKRSKDPGDNAEMVQARRAFLELGYYQPLAEQVAVTAADLLPDTSSGETARMVDMGCGEGYYTALMQQQLAQHNDLQLAGLDISKHAVKAACSRTKALTWMVASGAAMPVAEQSLDLVTVLFSRLMPDEFRRTLKPGASLLVTYPGEGHLLQLRELIYDEVRQSGFDPASVLGEGFEAVEQQTVRYDFTLQNQQEIQQLLAMTPHGWRINPAAKARISELNQLTLTLDVNLARFTRS